MPSDESDYVGVNIANSRTGMDEFDISDRLQKEFADWIGRFERGALDNPKFPWASFHKEGLALSRRLKQEIGEIANVVYVKPFEDPDHEQPTRDFAKSLVPYLVLSVAPLCWAGNIVLARGGWRTSSRPWRLPSGAGRLPSS